MSSSLIVFVLVYCLMIILALSMPKKWHYKILQKIEKGASFKEYNYKFAYYRTIVFWSGVVGGIITLIIKGIFY